jgi:hypothetical protein
MILKALAEGDTEAQVIEMIRRRLTSVKYGQDMLELLARLEGELTKSEGAERGVAVIVLNNQGPRPLNPEVFREQMQGRVLRERAASVSSGERGEP